MKDKIKKYAIRMFATIGAGVVFMYIALIIFAGAVADSIVSESIDDAVVLEWDIRSLPGEVVDDLAVLQGESAMSMFDVVMGLKQAAEDDRVKGIVLKMSLADEGVAGLAAVQEVRSALTDFKASGKKIYAWADTFSEVFTGHQAYYLASVADEIHIQPSGDVALTGFAWETPFFKDFLEDWGIKPEIFKRHEYKNAMDPLVEESLQGPFREAIRAVMEAQRDQLAADIGESRELSAERVLDLVDQGPFPARSARDMGLVDALSYRDELFDTMRKNHPKASFLYFDQYRYRRMTELAGDGDSTQPKIALVYGVGNVLRGRQDPSPFGGPSLSSETVAANLRAAAADEDVKAILFRIDSPGGSYVASDTVWREIQKIREEGTPVVASMGRIAGSGGYFVAMGTDHIICRPGTITGSIGVISGLFDTREFWDRLGVAWDAEILNRNAVLGSGTQPPDEADRTRMNRWLDAVYDDFITKAAAGRGMDKERLHAVAKGRIWAGSDALASGLVDELGGFSEAIAACKKLAKIDEKARVRIQTFPKKEPTVLDVLEMLARKEAPESSEDVRVGNDRFALPTMKGLIRATLHLPGVRRELTMPVPEGWAR